MKPTVFACSVACKGLPAYLLAVWDPPRCFPVCLWLPTLTRAAQPRAPDRSPAATMLVDRSVETRDPFTARPPSLVAEKDAHDRRPERFARPSRSPEQHPDGASIAPNGGAGCVRPMPQFWGGIFSPLGQVRSQ